jgi:hypothetical protein
VYNERQNGLKEKEEDEKESVMELEILDRSLWRSCFGTDYGAVARQSKNK